MRENNSESKNSKDKMPKKILPKTPKFNGLWIYGIILAMIIGFNLLYPGNSPVNTSYEDFESKMLKSHDVEKVDVYQTGNNAYEFYVYIKKDRLNNDKYKDISSRSTFGSNTGPHYVFTTFDYKGVRDKIESEQKDFPVADQIKIKDKQKQESPWLSFLFQWI